MVPGATALVIYPDRPEVNRNLIDENAGCGPVSRPRLTLSFNAV